MTNFDKILIRFWNRQIEALIDLSENMTIGVDFSKENEEKYGNALNIFSKQLMEECKKINVLFKESK